MGARDPRVDAYIAKSPDFAKPILAEIRRVIHEACPDVEETMKWSTPTFIYKGMLCGMASFKAHCTFGFWKSTLVLGAGASRDAAGQFGRLTKLSDLPSRKILAGHIHKAMALNEDGVKMPSRSRAVKARPLKVPNDFASALKNNKTAKKAFDAFSPSHRNEYVEWIDEAKRDETRKRRMQQAIEWITKGKSRNWKYE